MLISLVMISSCVFKNASIKKDIQTLQSQKINFPNGMLKYIPNKRTFEPESNVIIARKSYLGLYMLIVQNVLHVRMD